MLNDFVSLLFPNCCILSNEPLARGEQYISTACANVLPKYDLHSSNENLEKKFSGLVNVKHVLAYYKFSKKSGVQKILHHIKYKNLPEVGELAGRWFGYAMIEAGYQNVFDVLLPIPLHKAKKNKRGYNQSDYIAKGMAEALQTNWSGEILQRIVNTKTQTKKGRAERFSNIENIYAIKDSEWLVGKKILIVDDMITTGATVEQAARLLLNMGCKEVSIAALAAAE